MFTRQILAMQDTTSSSSNSKGKQLTQWLLQGLTIAKTSLLLVLTNVGASLHQGVDLRTQWRHAKAFTIVVVNNISPLSWNSKYDQHNLQTKRKSGDRML
jgi:hypothetical protein